MADPRGGLGRTGLVALRILASRAERPRVPTGERHRPERTATESGVYRTLGDFGPERPAHDAGARSAMIRPVSPPPEPTDDVLPAADAELVRRVAEGDRDALGELYDRYGALLLGVGVRILRARRDAEDIAHDVFLEVWRRAGSYEPGRASVRSWLLMMMRSRALDRRKSAGFSWGVPLEAEPVVEPAGVEPLHAELSVDRARAVRALAALPDVQREVLLLGYFDGLSSSEIAEALSLPIGTVKSRVAAALRALRESLGEPSMPPALAEPTAVRVGERP